MEERNQYQLFLIELGYFIYYPHQRINKKIRKEYLLTLISLTFYCFSMSIILWKVSQKLTRFSHLSFSRYILFGIFLVFVFCYYKGLNENSKMRIKMQREIVNQLYQYLIERVCEYEKETLFTSKRNKNELTYYEENWILFGAILSRFEEKTSKRFAFKKPNKIKEVFALYEDIKYLEKLDSQNYC